MLLIARRASEARTAQVDTPRRVPYPKISFVFECGKVWWARVSLGYVKLRVAEEYFPRRGRD